VTRHVGHQIPRFLRTLTRFSRGPTPASAAAMAGVCVLVAGTAALSDSYFPAALTSPYDPLSRKQQRS
jgi:hypothetical protein